MANTADLSTTSASRTRSGLTRRIFNGVGIQVLFKIVAVGRVFIIVPFFLAAHGVVGYADWLKLLAIAQVFSICALGQGDYYNYHIRRAASLQKYEEMNNFICNSLQFHASLLLIFTTIFIPIFYFYDIKNLLNLSHVNSFTASITLYVLSIFNLGSSFRVCISGVYTAFNEFARGEAIFTINVLFLIVALIVGLLLGAPLWVLALLHVAITPVLNSLIAFWDFRRRYPPVRLRLAWPWPREWSRVRSKALVTYAVPAFVDRALQAGPTVLFGLFAVDAALVVQFSLARRALSLLDGNFFARVFSQEMIRQRLQGDQRGFRRLHRLGAVAVGLLGGATFGALLAFWPVFLPLWTQNTVQADMVLFTLLMVEQTFHTYGRHSIMLLRLGGQLGAAALWASLGALLFVVLAVPALALGSIYGMVVVLILVKLVFFYMMPPLSLRRRMPEADALTSIALPFLAGAVVALPSYWIMLQLIAGIGRLVG